jgi:hypothetical protein
MDPNLHPSFGGGSLAIKCESKFIIKLPPPNGWANEMGKLSLGTIFAMHNQSSSK